MRVKSTVSLAAIRRQEEEGAGAHHDIELAIDLMHGARSGQPCTESESRAYKGTYENTAGGEEREQWRGTTREGKTRDARLLLIEGQLLVAQLASKLFVRDAQVLEPRRRVLELRVHRRRNGGGGVDGGVALLLAEGGLDHLGELGRLGGQSREAKHRGERSRGKKPGGPAAAAVRGASLSWEHWRKVDRDEPRDA